MALTCRRALAPRFVHYGMLIAAGQGSRNAVVADKDDARPEELAGFCHSRRVLRPPGLLLEGLMEASMNIQAAGGILIVGGLLAVAPLSSRSPAQTNDANVSAPQSAAPNTTKATPKHRYWRFRGGTHPHYGSRRVHT